MVLQGNSSKLELLWKPDWVNVNLEKALLVSADDKEEDWGGKRV